MTTTERPVTRKTTRPYSTLHAKARQVVVSILPGDVLLFREHGCRTAVLLPIQEAFRYAIKRKAGVV